MPAAAVIPAPVAYIKVVAVKASVVEYQVMTIRQFVLCKNSFHFMYVVRGLQMLL